MKKIDLKRILMKDDFGSQDLIFEFKVLSEFKESDKKELIDFLFQELANKKIIRKDYYIEYDLFDYINLEEINKNINKITNIDMSICDEDCLEFSNVEYDKSKLFCICNNQELMLNFESVLSLKDKYNDYSIYSYLDSNYYKNIIKRLLNIDNFDIEKIININNISIINILRGVSKRSKRNMFDKEVIVDVVFDKNEVINVSFENRYESGGIDKIELNINLLELFKEEILELVKKTIKYNLEVIKYDYTPVLYLQSMNLTGLNDKIIFDIEDQYQNYYKEINIKPLKINEILISQKEAEILKLRNEIEVLKDKK